MHKQRPDRQNGFTLIEVIVSLILIGVMAVVVGMGFLAITRGYVFSRQNNETALQAQVAMARIVKELNNIGADSGNTITAAAANSITYTTNGSSRTISQSGSFIKIDGITLTGNVNSFVLSYFNAAGAATTTLADIRRVDISISLTGAGNVISTFSNSAKITESYF